MLKKAENRAKKTASEESYKELEIYLKKLIFPENENDFKISKKFNNILR
jgi:hypothetical protein